MEDLTLNSIPSILPGLLMVYTGAIWLLTKDHKIRMDSRIIAYTLLLWGIIYIASFFIETSQSHEELIARVFVSRLVLILICLSQSLPLTVSYIRHRKRGHNGWE